MDMNHHGNADDLAVKKDPNPSDGRQEMDDIRSFENVMDNIKVWMDTYRLKMNSSKVEVILFGSRKQIDKCHTTSLR